MSAFSAKIVSIITAVIMALESFSGFAFIKQNKKTDFERCKNVIFMIGDGMGFNSINKTKAEEGIDELNMDTILMRGESKTASANSPITDSAAGGTALSTGVRVNNSAIGVYAYDEYKTVSYPINLTEIAISQGKLAGVITTDSTSGATPATFSAHTDDRHNEADITSQQLAGDLNLVWGDETESFTNEAAEKAGFEVITNKDEMNALEEGSRSFGQFSDDVWHRESPDGMPTLAEMTAKAIDLLDDDEDGFFLMVEGAHIDKNSHKNNGEGMKDALLSFDDAIGTALKYAEENGDTLVVITADHETGGIAKIGGKYVYTRGQHSGYNVPLLVYGCDNFIKNGEAIKNKEISRRVACVMDYTEYPARAMKAALYAG